MAVSDKLQSLSYRKMVIGQINGTENKERKRISYKQNEVYNDRIRPYILEYLRTQFKEETVLQMPIIDSINLSKRIVNKEASLYVQEPKREFKGVNPEQATELDELYDSLKIDTKLLVANQKYCNQGQAFLMVVPTMSGKLTVRTLMAHQVDVIPNEFDPDKADCYIMSTYDRSLDYYKSDGLNQDIADADDYKAQERYVVWTAELNFIMDGKGNIVSDVLPNPIGRLPFVDISSRKDFEFFVRGGEALTNFTIQYASALSDLTQVIKMQGWSVAYLKAPAELMPTEITVGPNRIIRLTIDPNNPIVPEFGFASPSPDLAGSISFIEMLLANFITSKGLDSKVISSKLQSTSYSSGTERLLAMLDMFEATRSDMDLFSWVEDELFELIKLWSNAMVGTPLQVASFVIPNDAEVDIDYHCPEMVTTEQEKLTLITTKMDAGLMSRVEAIAELRDVDVEEAAAIAQEIDSGMMAPMPQGANLANNQAEGN